ncbi:hypothetical protein IQ13_1365 [Lacibacter cauensis]|uniref:Uncharacterized protein n=1 Tax=Lacibacter cauensis TaxID=510947 RepID=A0A562SPP4_9BACT|nr:hypothetical protein [Lacibacter cauensis]TWI83257.1 hypothetical protein IQ13_1365 [Lacibacter cauensis]
MKKLLLGIFALLFVISLSAWHLVNKPKPAAKETVYTWHKYNTAGTAELSPAVVYTGSDVQARNFFGCPEDNETICARAYDEEGQPLDIYIMKALP